MRDIKFRGKREDNGEWIYGDLCMGMGGYEIMPKCFFGTVIFNDENESNFNREEDGLALGGWYSVIEESIGQFTGLKDKNGKEIWEGDIVEHTFYNFNQENTKIIQEVYFDNGCFNLKTVGKEVFPVEGDRNNVPLFWCLPPNKIDVIGTVYDKITG